MGKYGFLNLDQYSMHTQIIKFVNNQKRVLDVGCAEGHLSKNFSLKGCEVVGIEID